MRGFLVGWAVVGGLLSMCQVPPESGTDTICARILIFVAVIYYICVMFFGSSQLPQVRKEAHGETLADNNHGGWWNLGRFDVIIALFLIYATFGIFCIRAAIDQYQSWGWSVTIQKSQVPSIIAMSVLWSSVAMVTSVIPAMICRLCRQHRPLNRWLSLLVAVLDVFFIFVVILTLVRTQRGDAMLVVSGFPITTAVLIMNYKVVRAESLSCLLPPWLSKKSGVQGNNIDTQEENILDSELVLYEKIQEEKEAVVGVKRTKEKGTLPTLWQRYWGWLIIASLLGVLFGLWSHMILRWLSRGEAVWFGILFALLSLLVLPFICDACKKAAREYRAERAEKALPYVVLALIALIVWYFLSYGCLLLCD